MPLTQDEEIEFQFLTRHLEKHEDINLHLEKAKTAQMKIEKGQGFENQEESIAGLRSCVFIRNITLAAAKYPKQLQDTYNNLTQIQMKSCIKITDWFVGKKRSHDKPTLFIEEVEHFDEKQFKELFEKFSAKPASEKTLKV